MPITSSSVRSLATGGVRGLEACAIRSAALVTQARGLRQRAPASAPGSLSAERVGERREDVAGVLDAGAMHSEHRELLGHSGTSVAQWRPIAIGFPAKARDSDASGFGCRSRRATDANAWRGRDLRWRAASSYRAEPAWRSGAQGRPVRGAPLTPRFHAFLTPVAPARGYTASKRTGIWWRRERYGGKRSIASGQRAARLYAARVLIILTILGALLSITSPRLNGARALPRGGLGHG